MMKYSHGCTANSIVFGGEVTLTCASSKDTTLVLPSANGRLGQFLVIVDGRMKWVDPPNPDLIRLSQSVQLKADQSNIIHTFDYISPHDDPHPICSIIGDGDLERIINYHFININTSSIEVKLNTKANIINTKFNNVKGMYRNMKAINSSNGMLIIVYINEANKVILNKCMTEDGDGYFSYNETDIIVPINVLDIYPLHDKKLGIAHNDVDHNIIFTSCNLPDGNGIKTHIVIDNCPANVIKLASTRSETIVISYITSDGYAYYAYAKNISEWTIKMLPTNIKTVNGYLDMITFNGQSVAILYYTINKELMLTYTTDQIEDGIWNHKYIDTVTSYKAIQLIHLENNEFIILCGNKIYNTLDGTTKTFDYIQSAASIIIAEGNLLIITGIDINGQLYSYTYDYYNKIILYQGIIVNHTPSIIETQIMYTTTGTLINSYLNDQSAGVIISPFKHRFAYDLEVNINCLVK